jgi:excisionase family DNA binding protein
MSKIVTLDDAAARLRVNRRTIQRLIKAGQLRRFRRRVGDRKVYVELAELQALSKPRVG